MRLDSAPYSPDLLNMLGDGILQPGDSPMAKRSVTTKVEEKQLRRASRYLKTRRPSDTVKAALDFVAEKAAHEQVVRKYSGIGRPNAFQNS
jgi:hypothetical protein